MSFNVTKTGKPINLQAENALAVSATDATATIYEPGTVYVGYAGTVALIPYGADATVNTTKVSFFCPAGSTIPVLTKRIVATGTTATGFVIMY